MVLPAFEVFAPESLEEALQLLATHGKRAKILAGGTDLLVSLKKHYTLFDNPPPCEAGPSPRRDLSRPGLLLSIHRIPGLSGIDEFRGGGIRIGAATLLAALSRSALVRSSLAALAEGASLVGSPQVRNRASVGGNLCNARPCMDTAPPVIALEGRLVLTSVRGEREVDADEFFRGPGETVLEPDELLREILFEKRPSRYGSAYFKLGIRRIQDIAVVSVGAAVRLDRKGKVASARIVLGSVGPTPLRSRSAEAFIAGRCPEKGVLEGAGEAAVRDSLPIDDHRASGAYRREMVSLFTRRALAAAVREAERKK